MPGGVGVPDWPPDPPDGPVEPPQPVTELAAPHSSSSRTNVRKTILNLRRRLAKANASRLGRPIAAAQTTVRELPKGEDGAERLATPPVLIVKVEVAELLLPLKTTEDGAKLQAAYCGRPVQLNCSVPV